MSSTTHGSFVSRPDEGLSWRRRNLETGYDAKNPYRYLYCYTAMLELDDRMLVAYCAGTGLHDLRIKSIPLSVK